MGTSPDFSSSRQRELKRHYKAHPPAMGVWTVRSRATGRVFVDASMNVEGAMNRARFELGTGRHKNAAMLREWRDHGPDNLQFEVVDTLKRVEDPLHDYTDDLADLLALWQQELR